MAKIVFYLNFNGKRIKTLDDLRENFSIDDILDSYHRQYFEANCLVKWLEVWRYNDELEEVKKISATDARGILKELIRIFKVTDDASEIEENLSLLDYLQERNNLYSEIKAHGLENYEALKKENEFLKQECLNLQAEVKNVNLKGAAVFTAFEETKKERDNLKSEIENLKQNSISKSDYENVKKELDDLKESFNGKKFVIDTNKYKLKYPKGCWVTIEEAGHFYTITDVGNCGELLIDKYRPRFNRSFYNISDAFKARMTFYGIDILLSKESLSNEFLYFSYKEV